MGACLGLDVPRVFKMNFKELPIKVVSSDAAVEQIQLPSTVSRDIFKRVLGIVQHYNELEGHRTGALLVLASDAIQFAPLTTNPSGLRDRNVCEVEVEGPLREAFALDGGILIDGLTGKILAERAHFYPRRSDFVLNGHGTRHKACLDVAADDNEKSVTIARSKDGPVTVFSLEHLNASVAADCCCFRVVAQSVETKYPIIMRHIPFVRIDSGTLHIPEVTKSELRKLEVPVRVVAFVGPSRVGKSALCGKMVGDESLFPSVRSTCAITEGIDAAAVRHPDGGCIVFLDSEGSGNPTAPSRTEVGAVCLMLASVIVDVDYDILHDRQTEHLGKLRACGEMMSPSSQHEPPFLFVVVNGCRLHDLYGENELEKALNSDGTEGGRASTREAIKQYFPERCFVSIPDNRDEDFGRSVQKLRSNMFKTVRPLMHDGKPFDGSMFTTLLDNVVHATNNSEKIDIDGIFNDIVKFRIEKLAQAALEQFMQDHKSDADFIPDLPADIDFQKYWGAFQASTKTNSTIVNGIVQNITNQMESHYACFKRANDRKGRESVREENESWDREISREYEYQDQLTAAITAGGAGGAAGVGIALASGPIGWIMCAAALAGSVGAGWGATRATRTWKRTTHMKKQTRIVKWLANGRKIEGDWSPPYLYDITEMVEREGD